MKIDLGAPSEYGVSGINGRINKLKRIKNIPYGINLDLGTGVGAYYPELKKYSKKLFAFDIELSFLQKFLQKNPADKDKIFISSSESIALKNDIFDAVFAIEVLEHVENLELTLKEIHRILKTGGLFYITIPNKFFPIDTHMVHLGKYYVKGRYVPFLSMLDFIHNRIGTARRFSKRNIFNDFTKYGFDVVGVDFMMPPFDYFKFGRKYIKKITDKIEKSFLKSISMTLIAVLRKN